MNNYLKTKYKSIVLDMRLQKNFLNTKKLFMKNSIKVVK